MSGIRVKFREKAFIKEYVKHTSCCEKSAPGRSHEAVIGLTLTARSGWSPEACFFAVETCCTGLTVRFISQTRNWGEGTRWTQLGLPRAFSYTEKQAKKAEKRATELIRRRESIMRRKQPVKIQGCKDFLLSY